jgi:Transglycosylase SLT domain/SPOR domain
MSGPRFSNRLGALTAVASVILASLLFVGAWGVAWAAGQQLEPSIAARQAAQADPEAAQKALCTLIETAATDNGLPVGFFTRLIWKESRFRSEAVSPKGAQGIAQFMPGTAEERGLEDPFDTATAIPASADFLGELKQRFGNLGLAAAAYNAGPERVSDWLADSATLPFETQDYVLSVTGVPAVTWADPDSEATLPTEVAEANNCLALAALLKDTGAPLAPEIETASAPWGVQVAGGFSRALAINTYAALKERFPSLLADKPPMIVGGRMPGRGTRAFYRVRVPVETRAEGDAFCKKLKAAGGICIVLKS